jgi:hypothetical protein
MRRLRLPPFATGKRGFQSTLFDDDDRPQVNTITVAIVIAGVLVPIAFAARRAGEDWPSQLRLVQTLSIVASWDTSGEPLDLREVELIGASPCATSLSVTIALVRGPRDIGVFELEAPLGELAPRCRSWRDAGTPLLLSGDELGDAVVHGPDGYLVGRMATWSDPEPTGRSLS